MKRFVDITPPLPAQRTGFGYLSVPPLLAFALAVGACSSSGADSATTSNETPVVTTETSTAITDPASDGDDLDTYLTDIETGGFSGVIAVRDGDVITTRAYGVADRENDVPVDAETVFDIGSITKQFTGAAILRLEMDGLLSVNDPLGDHVPGLPDDKGAITLHQLLTHTAGLPHGFGPDDQPIGRSEFLTLVAATPLASDPGERYEYSNVGYALLAAVIEFETGGPYEEYLRTALFEPAGMFDTGYLLPDWDDHTIAVGYDHASGARFGRPNEQLWDVDGPYWNLLGNGGILSTGADMLRWDAALLGEQVLDATAKSKFFAPHVLDVPEVGIGYGYGWAIIPTTGAPLITHDGSNGFFYADFLRLVDHDVAVFIAANSDRDEDGDLTADIANHVLDGALEAMFEGDD